MISAAGAAFVGVLISRILWPILQGIWGRHDDHRWARRAQEARETRRRYFD